MPIAAGIIISHGKERLQAEGIDSNMPLQAFVQRPQ